MKELSSRPCAHCGKEFLPKYTSMQMCCTLTCARLYAIRERKQREKGRKQALERIPDLIKVAQREFNAYIRLRDAGQPCICCGSTGSASHLRFDERNCHAQRKACNRYGAGRAVDYRIGLIARIGKESVEALEASNEPHKWTHDELRQIAAIYRQKFKDLRNKNEHVHD
jgi:hypothetical protein